jgi:hypothetical protein
VNLLGAVLYDPAGAVTKNTTAGQVMTAFDTTNLRLAITVPAHGFVRIKIMCAIHGATTYPAILLGVMDGATIRGRVAPQQSLGGTATATAFVCCYADFVIGGLTPGAMNLDAAYGVETGVASSGIKYGGANDTTVNNAFGGFSFEVWDPRPLPTAAPGASAGVPILGANAGNVSFSGTWTHTGHVAYSDGIAVTASTSNRAAISATGNGTGAGIIGTGGATGNGLTLNAGATSGRGAFLTGSGGNEGLRVQGGATGDGARILGGGTSGFGLNITTTDGVALVASSSGTNRNGATFVGVGTGHGIQATSGGGATGDGIRANSAATNGNGMGLVGSGTGDGLLATGGGSAGGDGIAAAAGGGVDFRGAITGNVTGNLSGSVGSVTTVSDKTGYALSGAGVTAIWGEVMEGSITAVQYMRGFSSALMGKVSGMGTTTVVFRDLADSKDRITATVDIDGNRSAVTRDLT